MYCNLLARRCFPSFTALAILCWILLTYWRALSHGKLFHWRASSLSVLSSRISVVEHFTCIDLPQVRRDWSAARQHPLRSG